MEQEWFLYIVRCRDNSLYSGITDDLEARIKQHNKGTGAKYTFSRRPVTLVYSESYQDASEARKREEQIKGWPKIKKEQLVNSSTTLGIKGFSSTTLGINESHPLRLP